MELMQDLMILYRRQYTRKDSGYEEGRPFWSHTNEAYKVLMERGYIEGEIGSRKRLLVTKKGIHRILTLSFDRLTVLIGHDPNTLNIAPTSGDVEYILKPKMIRMGIARLSKYLTSDDRFLRDLAKEVIDEA